MSKTGHQISDFIVDEEIAVVIFKNNGKHNIQFKGDFEQITYLLFAGIYHHLDVNEINHSQINLYLSQLNELCQEKINN